MELTLYNCELLFITLQYILKEKYACVIFFSNIFWHTMAVQISQKLMYSTAKWGYLIRIYKLVNICLQMVLWDG